MTARIGGLAWMRLTPEAINELKTWSVVILNDANTASNPEQPEAHLVVQKIKKLNPECRVLISFNAYSVFVKDGKPNVYWPVQQKIFAAAEKHNAWLMVDGQHVTAWKGTWLFDLRNPYFRKEFAALVNEYAATFPDLDGIHFDELHRTLRFLSYPAYKLPIDWEWETVTKSFLRSIKLPYMGNGTYELSKNHKTKSRGRYFQNATQYVPSIKYDLELPIANRWTVLNPVGIINKPSWKDYAYGTGMALQYHLPSGATNYASVNIEKFL